MRVLRLILNTRERRNLNPAQLLNIFVAKEGERFLKHFREATNVLETYLESISQSTKIAQGLSDEAVFFTDETFDLVQRLDTKINRMDGDLKEMKKSDNRDKQQTGSGKQPGKPGGNARKARWKRPESPEETPGKPGGIKND